MQPKSFLATGILLAACETTANGVEDTCGASDFQALLGQPLAAVSLPAEKKTRVIEPATMVTMDYNAERLNIRLDEAGVIVALDCG